MGNLGLAGAASPQDTLTNRVSPLYTPLIILHNTQTNSPSEENVLRIGRALAAKIAAPAQKRSRES